MKITVGDDVYDYDAGKLMVSEAMLLKQLTGLNLKQWNEGLGDMDPVAVKGLIYLLKVRAGETVDWLTLDFDLGALNMEDDEPDPPPVADAA